MWPELLAQQVEVALDHCGRVADLVGDASRQLTDCSELLAHHQLPLRRTQLGIGRGQIARALLHLPIK
ncbi:hypothetical protein SDC9_123404 [bioreactor metagenome]|uniref:Uncharacterized protein n=1 Tax=bioreactor metagenome TaxID=1076179 RepID=A0A645CHJ5_9ZZZZ